MIAHVIYTKLYDFTDNCMTVGGVQSYVLGLIPVFSSLGMDVSIYQYGENEKTVTLSNGIAVNQIETNVNEPRESKIEKILNRVMENYNDETDTLVFMANEITCPNRVSRSIAIQHGISWDTLSEIDRPEWQNRLSVLMKADRAYKIIRKLNDVKCLVCVDHNFPNWLRSTATRFHVPITVIPNFTKIAPEYEKPSDELNIIFARRFFTYRGTRLFAKAIPGILDSYPHVKVTLAGNGPDEGYLREKLEQYGKRVVFTQYKAEDALPIHADKHIAVIPTLNSEGTSLSLLEAMSAQCAVVTTDVGGLSNIVIDGYNALYAEPDATDLAEKISFLIESDSKREQLSRKAYETVKYGFSYESWAEKWKRLLLKLYKE